MTRHRRSDLIGVARDWLGMYEAETTDGDYSTIESAFSACGENAFDVTPRTVAKVRRFFKGEEDERVASYVLLVKQERTALRREAK